MKRIYSRFLLVAIFSLGISGAQSYTGALAQSQHVTTTIDEPVVLEGSVVTRVEEMSDGEAGPYSVEVAEGLQIRDGARKKNIAIEVCYPKGAGQFPIIIFSHGAIASARDYRLLAAYWASHGYVCVLPTHDDAVALHMTPGQKISVLKLVKLAKVSKASIEQRQLDISKTIEALPSIEERVPNLANKMDEGKIALCGHHAGAFAVQASAGGAMGKANKEKISDSRIKAVVAVTGKDWQQPDVSLHDLNQVKLPLMVISLSIDGKSLRDSRNQFYKAMENAPSGNKYFVTADLVGKIDKPSIRSIRNAVRNSNVDLIPFHPFRKLRGAFRSNGKPSLSRGSEPGVDANDLDLSGVKVGEVSENERVGANVLQSLGLGSLLPAKADRRGFNFLMSYTIPFLDGYLKNDSSALEKLISEDAHSFGDMIEAKVERY
jgi:dienelactone hydrolase